MSRIVYLENCHGIKDGNRIYLRKKGSCFDFCNDSSCASKIPDDKVADIFKYADSYMAQYGADSMGVMNCLSPGREEVLEYIRNKKTVGFFIVSVHWYALGLLNHRHVFTSDYAEASAIAKWYHDTYSNKWQFSHAVYIDEEAIYEEW